MNGQISRSAPSSLTDALEASARDIAAGRVADAAATQREAFEKARSGDGGTPAKTA